MCVDIYKLADCTEILELLYFLRRRGLHIKDMVRFTSLRHRERKGKFSLRSFNAFGIVLAVPVKM